MLYDQLAGIYSTYQVHGAAFKITCVGVTANSPGMLMLTGRDEVTIPVSSLKQSLEQNNVSSRVVTGYEGMNKVVFNKYLSIKRIKGLKKLMNEGVTSFGSSPTNRVFGNVLWQSLNESSTSACNLLVQIKFYVSLKNKKLISMS